MDRHRPPARGHGRAPSRGITTRLLTAVDGPPPRLPAALDGAAEAWARASPRLRALLVGLAALALVATAGRGAARSPWGPPAEVVVATADLHVGRVLGLEDVDVVRWPRATIPPGALADPDPAIGRPLAAAAAAGTPLTDLHLADDGPATGLPAGHVAVPLPTPPGISLRAGHRVDLLGSDGAHGGTRLAAGARVLGVDGETTWVAVRRDEAPAIVGAAAWGDLSIAVLPRGSVPG